MGWIEYLLIVAGSSLEIFVAMECQGSLIQKVNKKQLTAICFIVAVCQLLAMYIGYFLSSFLNGKYSVKDEALLGEIISIGILIGLGIRLIGKAIRNVDGSNTLVANNAQLNSGASQLADGTNQIVSGVDQLTTGSKTLSEGAHTLADGMVQFNEEGINKILDAYNGDLKPFTDKLQAVIDAGEEYQTYSAIADGQTGSVKFIYKLASIDAKADSDK